MIKESIHQEDITIANLYADINRDLKYAKQKLTELKGEISTTIIGDFNTLLSIMNKTSAAAAAKSLQSCPTLCDPIDGSPPVSPVPGILKARTLEWVTISFSNA